MQSHCVNVLRNITVYIIIVSSCLVAAQSPPVLSCLFWEPVDTYRAGVSHTNKRYLLTTLDVISGVNREKEQIMFD